jgi:hypothetical protein
MGVSGIANVDLADRCNRKLQCAFVMVLNADECCTWNYEIQLSPDLLGFEPAGFRG